MSLQQRTMILFFLFFEVTLIPTFFLIGKWGYFEKEKAAFSFLIYNGFGSAILLIVIIVLFARTGTSNIDMLRAVMASDTPQLIAAISDPLKNGAFHCLIDCLRCEAADFPIA